MKKAQRLTALLLAAALLISQAYTADLDNQREVVAWNSGETAQADNADSKGDVPGKGGENSELSTTGGSDLEPYPLQQQTVEEIREEKLAELEEKKGSYCEDSIVLGDTSKEQAEALAERLGAEVRLTKDETYAVLYLPEGTTVADVYEDEEYAALLSEMTLDYEVSVAAMDANGNELYASRPGVSVNDALYVSQTWLDYVNLQETWNVTKGNGVRIAVIDTGIDTDHEEFVGRISDLSYNASLDKVVKDFDLSIVEDEQGHGTAVAGVISAAMDNGKGITGIAPEAELVVIKCECNPDGTFKRSSDLMFGLAYALECDADVVNMSFGTGENIFEKYTKLAVDSDMICVAAAGNDGNSLESYPAADPNVIGVGALDANTWELASYSNFGDNSEILAPGTTYTTTIGGGYKYETGTSLASPIVAAAVALYLSENPHQEYDQICEVLQASSIDLGSLGEDWYCGYGLLDINALVCEEKGTITYEMQTDEVDNRTQIFVKGHTLQNMPEPERMNVVFDSWFYDREARDEVDYYSTRFTENVTLYANWINEDEGVPYTYVTLADETVEICSYTGKKRYLTVPSEIEGKRVSSIGERAFAGNKRLRNVVLPAGLTKIGDYAFYQCTALLSMDIPETVQTIGDYAFCDCARLRGIGMAASASLANVGEYAFSQTGIQKFLIPTRLTKLETGVFYGCSALTSITVAPGNAVFVNVEKAVYTADKKTLVYFPAGIGGTYQIAAGTTGIGKYAFAYSRLNAVEFPEGMTEIKEGAFIYSDLEKVSLPKSLAVLEEKVFAYNFRLGEVVFADGISLAVIPREAFLCGCRLKAITIPKSVERIDELAFSMSNLGQVTFQEGGKLTTLGGDAFSYCQLQEIMIPDTVTSINGCCFNGCPQLEEVQFGSASACYEILANAFYDTASLKQITFPAALRMVGECAFYGSGLERVEIGKNLTEIGYGAFSGCRSLQGIAVAAGNSAYKDLDGILYKKDGSELWVYPAGKSGAYTVREQTKKIQKYAFADAVQLTEIRLPESLQVIGESAFSGCGKLQTPVFPASLTEIEEYAFAYCDGMSNPMVLSKGIMHLGRFAFYYDFNLKDIRFEAESELPRIGYGAFAYCGIATFTVPERVSSIGMDAFAGCKNLLTITFEADSRLSYLAAGTFYGANELRQITFEPGSALVKIEARVCEGLQKLEKIDLSNCVNLTEISNYAFQQCAKLQTVILPESLKEIGRYAFAGCPSLTRFEIPKNVEFIGRYAFMDNGNLNVYFKSGVLPAELQDNWDYGIAGYYIGVADVIRNGDWEYALAGDGTASIVAYLGNAQELSPTTIDGYPVVSIGGKAFENNKTLKKITLPGTLKGIYQGAFRGTDALEGIVIPAGVTVIDNEAFRDSGIKSVTFQGKSNLESIGRYAFAGTKNLTGIAMPDSLEKIRDYAFYNSALEQITFGENSRISEIGRYAFAESGLTAIALPKHTEKIDYYAFAGTKNLRTVSFPTEQEIELNGNAFYRSGLTSVTIPKNMTYIGELCFAACENLASISVAAENSHYTSVDGVLFDKEKKKLICCPAGKTGDHEIPAQTLTLAFAAFEGAKIDSVTIPADSKLMTIGYRAFYDCGGLTEIIIPDGVQSVGRYAFYNCRNLETVRVSENSLLGLIDDGAFYNCNSLEAIRIPDGVQEIGEYAFYGCSSLIDVPISSGSHLRGIYGHAFEYTGITSLVMPTELVEVGDYAFSNSGLETLVFNEALVEIGKFAFADCGLDKTRELVIPASVQYIGTGALKGVTALEEITIPFLGNYLDDEEDGTFTSLFGRARGEAPESIHTVHVLKGSFVADNAFYDCSYITAVTLPDEVTWIGYHAFSGAGISSIYWPKNLITIGSGSFYSCLNLRDVTIPEGVKNILSSAFLHCQHLETVKLPESLIYMEGGVFNDTAITEIFIPKNVEYIGEAVFLQQQMECINLDAENPYYVMRDGVLYDADCTIALASDRRVPSKLIFPETVKTIGYGAFCMQYNIEEMILPEGLETIENMAFWQCENLKDIVIPDSVTSLGFMSFSDTGIQSFRLGRGIKGLGEVFSSCPNLERAEIPEGVTMLSVTFWNCRSLKEVVLPESLTEIGPVTFSYCTSLESIVIPKNVEVLSGNAFTGCVSMDAVIVAEGNPFFVSIDGLLYNADKTQLLYVPKKISGCVTVPEGVETLQTFDNCENLEEIILPESLKTIGDGCFNGCSSLKKITVGNNVENLGRNALDGTAYYENPDNWEDGALYVGPLLVSVKPETVSLIVKEGTTTIAGYVGTWDLAYLYLPDSVKYISEDAFIDCRKLRDFHMSSGIKKIGACAFQDCESLTSIYVPEGVESVGMLAFAYCDKLEYARVGAKNGTVNIMAFCGDKNLKTLSVPHDKLYGWSWTDTGTMVDNLVIANTDTMGYCYVNNYASQDMTLFCKVDRNDNDWYQGDDGWTRGMTAYYKGEWNLATFFINGVIVKMDPVLTYDIVQAPADALIQERLPEGAAFKGWDINGDGKADQLPATLSADMDAHAVLDIPISSMETAESLEVEAGYSEQLKLKFTPFNYNQSDAVTWSSADAAIATVAADGTVTGVAAGTTAVTATLTANPSIKAVCNVTVTPVQYGIKLAEKSGTVIVGNQIEIPATVVLPDGDSDTTTWISGNTAIATVADGVVTAVAPGETTITITHGSYQAEYGVSVTAPLKGITINGSNKESLNVGETLDLKVDFNPANTTDSRLTTWYSTKPGVAKVDSTGKVTAVAPGTAVIHAVVGKFDVTYNLTVYAPIQWIVLNTTTGTLRLNKTKQLEVIYEPSNTTDSKDVVWSTDNEEVATVDENGLVTPHKAGHAVITGTVGSHSATYTVTVVGVRDEDTGITVTNSDDSEMAAGTDINVAELDEAEMERLYGPGWRSFLWLLIEWLRTHSGARSAVSEVPVYDISLMRNGEAVQPDTEVDVDIPVPEGTDPSDVIIYRIEEDGTITNMDARYEDGCFRFKTNHFSVYAMGTLNSAANMANMEGTVTSRGNALTDVKVSVLSGKTEVYAAENLNGSYSISGLSDGTYTLKVSRKNYATRTYEFTVKGGVAENIDVTLNLIGDIDGDGYANMKDLNRICDHIRGKKKLTGYGFACADITGDGDSVDARDLNRLCDHVRNKRSLWE